MAAASQIKYIYIKTKYVKRDLRQPYQKTLCLSSFTNDKKIDLSAFYPSGKKFKKRRTV